MTLLESTWWYPSQKITSPKDAFSVTEKDTDLNVTTAADTDSDTVSDTDSGDSDTDGETNGDTDGHTDDAVNSTLNVFDNPDGSLSAIGNQTFESSLCLNIEGGIDSIISVTISVTIRVTWKLWHWDQCFQWHWQRLLDLCFLGMGAFRVGLNFFEVVTHFSETVWDLHEIQIFEEIPHTSFEGQK